MGPAPQNNNKKVIAGLVVLVAITLLVIGTKALTSKNQSPENQIAQTASGADTNNAGDIATNDTAVSDNSVPDSASVSSYKDGTYTAKGSYVSPGGNESVTVSLTLKDGVVTASTVEEGAGDPEALEYQHDFIGGYKTFVNGKDIDNIHVSRVSGSSLTSIGFNDALTQIKDQAKS